MGYNAPKPLRQKLFNSITIERQNKKTYKYCINTNSWFCEEDQQQLLYLGLPCIYTDNRFSLNNGNVYATGFFYFNYNYPICLKTGMRWLRKSYNLPVGTIVDFRTSWYYKFKKIKTNFTYIVKKENPKQFDFKVNHPSFFNEINLDDKIGDLVNLMRLNGFIVRVYEVNNDGKTHQECLAYGHNKIVGFSTGDNLYYGYTYGIENILWDRFNEFDKWSKCNQIKKTLSNEEILQILIK